MQSSVYNKIIKQQKLINKSIRKKRMWVMLKEFRRFHSHDPQSLFQKKKREKAKKRGARGGTQGV